MKIISVEGNIGSGKTTLVQKLKETYAGDHRVVFLKEPVDIWDTVRDEHDVPILVRYYENPKARAFAFQIMAFITRVMVIDKAIEENKDAELIICERSLEADRHIFASMLYDTDKMDKMEYHIYRMVFDSFSAKYSKFSKMVYIQTAPQICSERINKRSRDGEDQITLDYLEMCHTYHENWLIHNPEYNQKIYLFNGNIDQSEQADEINNVIQFCEI